MNLKAVTESFFPPECATFDDIVDLTESSEVLDVLFQFIYPMRHPDLEWTEFPKLQALSEAAEKYQVYSAITVYGFIFIKNATAFKPYSIGLVPPNERVSCQNGDADSHPTVDVKCSSVTLELLFQFMCWNKYPDIESLEFSHLNQLADAAEKYRVFPAMILCKMGMK
ncbi:hypothetical protein H0H81_004220 [Sphagnurus paluster]|uniref:BTB domain-containing protein n=1 Tax=Sphagnurus paluster TaxID=117069 RepID=A0A9P7FSJ5_9AGAR|nr:hypothetical protein H0H81_004220 [Sphagnurus paluster]